MAPVRTPTVWVDSNVMAEVMSHGDLFRDYRRGAKLSERRRVMLQGSYWLAMGLDAHAVRSISYGHEAHSVIKRLAPPGSHAGEWTWAWASLLSPYVFPAWDGEFVDEQVQRYEFTEAQMDPEVPTPPNDNDACDQRMVDECRARGLVLVSRDGGVHTRAKRAGFDAVEPEAYAATLLTFDEARERFLARLDAGALHFLAEGGVERVPNRARSMRIALGGYRGIWEPPGFGLRYVLGS